MEWLEPHWVGIIAGILTAGSLLPPLIKLIRDKEPDKVPIGMLIVLFCGVSLWIYYGILRNDWPIIVTNCFSLLQNIIMITLRQVYKSRTTNEAHGSKKAFT